MLSHLKTIQDSEPQANEYKLLSIGNKFYSYDELKYYGQGLVTHHLKKKSFNGPISVQCHKLISILIVPKLLLGR